MRLSASYSMTANKNRKEQRSEKEEITRPQARDWEKGLSYDRIGKLG
jgi:hypothetical protein